VRKSTFEGGKKESLLVRSLRVIEESPDKLGSTVEMVSEGAHLKWQVRDHIPLSEQIESVTSEQAYALQKRVLISSTYNFMEYRLFHWALLQKRPIILWSTVEMVSEDAHLKSEQGPV